ncbi:MAG: O-antigen ligase family protein, partial [Pseudomonadota bacterium]
TRSRTAFALLAIPGFLGALRIYLWWVKSRAGVPGRIGQTRGALTAGIGLALVGVVAAGVLLAAPGRLGETLERFERLESGREYIWEDAPYSIARFWPVGAGLGTFDEVFQVDESLENITPRRAGRAHNDYLDVAIEAGAPGLALVAAWAYLIAWLTGSARKSRHRMVAWAGSAFLFAIALQSITDYPLRNQTILAAAGFALLILVRLGRPQDAKSTQ